jgi:phosphate transport system ATP-binding protein
MSAQAASTSAENAPILETQGLSLWYGAHHALKSVDLGIGLNRITAIIGPSGCGKSTLLRCFNRMNDLFPPIRYDGSILFHGQDILGSSTDLVGAPAPRRHGLPARESVPDVDLPECGLWAAAPGDRSRRKLEEIVESALRRSALWEEVKDRLNRSALSLSGGQQQRLCIARALAVGARGTAPDEPASALDPTATGQDRGAGARNQKQRHRGDRDA